MKRFILLLIALLPVLLIGKSNVVKVNDIVSAETIKDTVVVTLNIPEKMHMNLQEDFCFIEGEKAEGVSFGKTIYPEGGENHDGMISYHGTIKMKKSFKVDPKVKLNKIKIYVGYQFCFDSYCEPPEEFEIELSVR
ncbi:MAG: hypothetical protein CSB55_03885 [Candidatus Cloacimonadota bacterium]|nr:MAG: hypothetical protein CSB55_03885 [Candidatus Cloacimonadota bacterium]